MLNFDTLGFDPYRQHTEPSLAQNSIFKKYCSFMSNTIAFSFLVFKNNFWNFFLLQTIFIFKTKGLSQSWSYDSWILNYLCNQCLSPLKLWVGIPFMARCTRYSIMALINKAWQWLAAGQWFSPPIKKNCTHIATILLKVALTKPNLSTKFV